MDPAMNPYTPGSGLRPPAMLGRDSQLEAMDQLILRSKRRTVGRPMVMYGLRGVGKTVVLRRLEGMAEQHGWVMVHVEGQRDQPGRDSVRRQLSRGLSSALRSYAVRTKMQHVAEALERVVGNFSISIAGVELSRDAPASFEPARTGVLEVDLLEVVVEIATTLREHGQALGLFIDEFQDVDAELTAALLTAQHETQQRELPFYLLGAGLPDLPASLTEARSYAERLFNYQRVGALGASDAEKALGEPAQKLGASFETGSLALLLRASQGYPYFIQEYGSAIWDTAPDKQFTVRDAEEAVVVARARLDSGFFPTRWDRATPRERRYLAAMAEGLVGDDSVSSQRVADLLGHQRSSLSKTRHQLINKGIIYSPERGLVAFTVPGMADFINRQT